MKTKATIFFSLVILVLIAAVQFGFKHVPVQTNPGIQKASLFEFSIDADTFDFDKNEFREEIEKLREEIKKLKRGKFQTYFNSEEFKEEMNMLKEEIKNLKMEDFQFEFDKEQFKKDMKKLSTELKKQKFVWKDINIDIDLSGLEEGMETLKENMKHLKINLNGLSEELEKLNEFIKDVKTEMKSDGLIEDENEDVNIEFNKDEMIVNGKKVPDELFEKYRVMYKEHFGKDPDDCSHFRIN
ncbi:MAG: hypothetical protein P8Y81_02355 [Ignavibacteriaceae bacterium]